MKPAAAQTPEQKVACEVFTRELTALLAAMKNLGSTRAGFTELVILLLLYPLTDAERGQVLADVTGTIERVH
jgi:hypothetical protein